jgi:response regulator RpfG family c-di-GMP phosphodiesterase
MTSERSYSDTMTHEKAVDELKRCAGTQFDPEIVERFISICEKNIVGSRKKSRR